ncbi:Sodium/calcium exchanger protein-domain-containing protein [Rhypophila decipiens]|uniref:Sodium/calcium exchanger protein-domain-containing protein n=1 Tax=Rhypophila decipiens TaxID=261697 RepID=A0AAN6Y158_9PEZI|nr:Sodium/calcium exchanger protein-domain-containing protein [Rhypophila decipiens]
MASIDTLLFNISSFIAGLFLLEYGADKFIDHTAIVAKRLNVSPTLVGLLTCGAEWEELVVIIVALSQKNPNLAVGNLIGSSVANILASFSLGLLFMGQKAEFDRSSKIYTAVLLVVSSVFVLFLLAIGHVSSGSAGLLRFIAGVFLIIAFVVYVVSVCSLIYRGTLTAPEDSDSDSDSDGSSSDGDDSDSDSDGQSDDDPRKSSDTLTSRHHDEEHHGDSWAKAKGGEGSKEADHLQLQLLDPSSKRKRMQKTSKIRIMKPNKRPKPVRHHIFRLALGLAALLVSSYIIAHSASSIGHELGLSSTVVGTTILSLATTLPEKFVAILGGARRQPGIMIANTVGSNIFLCTLCGGVFFLWGGGGRIDNNKQLELSFTLFEALVMWLSAVIILGVVFVGGRRWMGGAMLCLYAVFLVVEITNGRQLDDD